MNRPQPTEIIPSLPVIGTCADCRFWERVDETSGRCRFSAPAAASQVGARVGWPVTSPNDWCGQWVSKLAV